MVTILNEQEKRLLATLLFKRRMELLGLLEGFDSEDTFDPRHRDALTALHMELDFCVKLAIKIQSMPED